MDNDSKSEIKVAECGRYKVPLVASNVGCYDETIVNGETGYLIDPSNPQKDWVKYLTKVIRDPKHRINTQNQAENTTLIHIAPI